MWTLFIWKTEVTMLQSAAFVSRSENFVIETDRLTKPRCTGRLQSFRRVSRLTGDWQHSCPIIAVFLRVLAIETENSLENFGRIQLIIAKFSREFYGEGCQSCQSSTRFLPPLCRTRESQGRITGFWYLLGTNLPLTGFTLTAQSINDLRVNVKAFF